MQRKSLMPSQATSKRSVKDGNGGISPEKNTDSGVNPANPVFALLDAVLQPVQQGVIVFDEDHRFLFCNRSAAGIVPSGTSEEAADLIKGFCPDAIFDKSRDEGSAITYADINVPGQDEHRLLGLEICHLEPAEGVPVYMMLLHDFSRWKKLDDMRSKFATTLSHRMRTPLTSIRNAVKILCDREAVRCEKEKERLLDIGWRNVEKLISDLDELQKVFMIESEEISVCRTMLRIKKEIKTFFEQMQDEGKIKGFKISLPDMTVFSGKSRFRDLVTAIIDAYCQWLGESPFIECSCSIRDEYRDSGRVDRRLKIYMRPRSSGWLKTTRESLREFLSITEPHRGLVLERLACALDGELEIGSGSTISFIMSLDPEFDRNKDLVHPLHMMVERADITGSEFSLVDLSLVGSIGNEARFTDILERCLDHEISDCGIISRGGGKAAYSLFVAGMDPNGVEALLNAINDNFSSACISSGEEIYPSLRWEIRYNRPAGLHGSPIDKILST